MSCFGLPGVGITVRNVTIHRPGMQIAACHLIMRQSSNCWMNCRETIFRELHFPAGDPLFPGNRAEVRELISEIRKNFPNKTIWLYTGYRWEDVSDLPMVQMCDVMVDGRYQKEQRNPQLYWRGSANQRIIDIPRTLSAGEVVLRPQTAINEIRG